MVIGIMGAMPEEVDQLCARLEGVTVEDYGGVRYHRGSLAGRQAVVCCAGMGKANAAATTQVLITKYGAEKIVFSGIAGNMQHDQQDRHRGRGDRRHRPLPRRRHGYAGPEPALSRRVSRRPRPHRRRRGRLRRRRRQGRT